METGGVDALVQAEADFAAWGDYQDSADRLKEATYAPVSYTHLNPGGWSRQSRSYAGGTPRARGA